jgi:hypothetical protein
VSLKRQISTPCSLRKCSSSSFLPVTPSAFQQAKRRALLRTVLLERAAIFIHEENNGLQDSPRAGCPCGDRGDRLEEPTGQLYTYLDGEVVEEIRNFLEWGGGRMGGDHQFRGWGLAAAVFTLAAAFFFVFPAASLVAAVDFGFSFLDPAVFLMAVTLGCEGASVTG